MSLEDRFQRIENALATIAEGQAKHDTEIAELRQLHQSLVLAQLKTNEQLRATDEKLNILIDTVDRIIRRDNNGK